MFFHAARLPFGPGSALPGSDPRRSSSYVEELGARASRVVAMAGNSERLLAKRDMPANDTEGLSLSGGASM
jgi:hypothetical protein